MYHLALRPSEGLGLWWDCIRGTKEIPSLYVHRAKNFKERYIPLISETIGIINELKEQSKGTPPIYLSWDGESSKRLFANYGEVINRHTLNENFKQLLIKNNIIDENGDAKYPVYILRKIRITTCSYATHVNPSPSTYSIVVATASGT